MKLFDKDSLWITLSNLIKLIFGFLVVPIIARNVAPGQLGKLDLLMAYGPFINQLISMGLTSSSTKFYKENDVNVIKYMQYKIWIRSVLYSSLFFVIFILFGLQQLEIPLLILIVYTISILLENISFLPLNQFYNENKFKSAALITTINVIIRHSLTLLLVLFMSDKLLGLTIGLLISSIYMLIVNLKYYKSILLFFKGYVIDIDLMKSVKKYSLPLFFLGIVGLMYQSSDRLLLSYLGGNSITEIGYLGMSQRIVNILTIGLSGLFTVWGVKAFDKYPDFILIKEKEKLILMMLGVLVLVIFIMVFFKALIIKILLTEEYRNSYTISILLIVAFVNNRIREILEKYFLKNGNSKLVTIIFITFGLLSLLLSGISLYFFGLKVMLVVRLFTVFFHALTLFYYLRKEAQIVNPLIMGLNFALSLLVVLALNLGFFRS